MTVNSGWDPRPESAGLFQQRGEQAVASVPDLASPELLDRIVAVETAATVGHSMGDVTEGMDWTEIEAKYGLVTELLPQPNKWRDSRPNLPVRRGYANVYTVHDRPPGMSEDGHERHRLSATAVIEKKGRVTVEDVARIWIRDIDPARFGILLGGQDQVIYYSAKAGVPPWEIGKFAYFPGAWGVTAMMIPIGVVNVGNPKQAALDALDVGRLKDLSGVNGNYALEIASAVAAGVAEGLSKDATAESVVQAALAHLSPEPRAEVERAIEYVPAGGDWRKLRELLDTYYKGRTILWPVETLGTALACFWVTQANPYEAAVAATNLGRDTDGRACVATSLAAALRGTAALPPEWEQIISEQVVNDPYTVAQRTPRETAAGLYAAANANLAEIRRQLDRVG
ncbi:ADP-ribosylglycohydrolase family protein [Rhizomonospora bruguierae]|uniref:ADP-ribosylglycohydrolase family protein n=1 Tax=Rhizomonospora bruguierae TaxID=1581705 RepID=UPI0020BE1817|nr:ADP-ribosylglycohydrolase family protein [Micromonospora sp. NBRC 107566]